jgi:membrane associated rhomboid family serine protease
LVPIIIIPLFFKVPALGYAIIWFGLQFLQGFMELFSAAIGGGIAWWAHIGGFLAGVVLIPLWRLGPDLTYDENAVRVYHAYPPNAAFETEKKENPSPWRRGPWG